MEVILQKDVPHLGRMGEVVRVKNGYARNFLIPREMAVTASSGQKKMLAHQKRTIEALKKKVQVESEEKAKSFNDITLKIKMRFNESGKMFGSVSLSDVMAEMEKLGHVFDKRDYEIPQIKTDGTHKVKLRLPGDVYTEFQLEVEAVVVKEKKKPKKEVEEEDAEAKKEASADATTETPDAAEEQEAKDAD